MPEDCPIRQEFLDWYEKTVLPEMKKWIEHAVTCPLCRAFILEGKAETRISQSGADSENLPGDW